MTYEEAKMQIQAIPEKIWDQLSEPDREAMEMAFSALQAQEAKTQLSAEGTTFDLISRQAAIEAMSESLKRVFPEHRQIAEKCLKALPSAQPNLQPTCNQLATFAKDTNVPTKDTISRQAAIDALVKAIRKDPYYDTIMRAERRTDDLQ